MSHILRREIIRLRTKRVMIRQKIFSRITDLRLQTSITNSIQTPLLRLNNLLRLKITCLVFKTQKALQVFSSDQA